MSLQPSHCLTCLMLMLLPHFFAQRKCFSVQFRSVVAVMFMVTRWTVSTQKSSLDFRNICLTKIFLRALHRAFNQVSGGDWRRIKGILTSDRIHDDWELHSLRSRVLYPGFRKRTSSYHSFEKLAGVHWKKLHILRITLYIFLINVCHVYLCVFNSVNSNNNDNWKES